jgi:tetrahydrodipicolinate N-succinyltransferase
MNKNGLCDPERYAVISIVGFRKPEWKKYEGWNLDQVANDMKISRPDAVIELTLGENNRLSKINFSMSDENVAMQLRKPWVVIGSDAGGFNPDSARGLVHPRAYVSSTAVVGAGALVMAGALVDVHATIGAGAVVWPGAVVSHDSTIGPNSFLSPNSTICGCCEIGSSCFVGASAVVVDHAVVPAGSRVKAGDRWTSRR